MRSGRDSNPRDACAPGCFQVGLPHAGKTVTITVGSDIYEITVEDGITIAAPRKASRAINRHKASDYG